MIIRHCTARSGTRALAQHTCRIRRAISTVTTDTPGQTSTAPPAADPAASSLFSFAEQYALHKQQQKQTANIGASIAPHYQPHTLLTNPPSAADITLELLLASESHQGHATSLWNPANARFIHGIRQGIHIISLETTAAHLRRAAKIVQEVSRRAGIILFVGTRPGQERTVARAAELASAYHLFERWIPGSITNGQQILGRLQMKVVNEKDEEVKGFEEQLFGRRVLRPDLVVCLNPLENWVLLHECALNEIPTIGVIDTNADPTWVTYPIPANDDSHRCIQVISGVLGRAGQAGTAQRLAAAAQGQITYAPARHLELPESDPLHAKPKPKNSQPQNESGRAAPQGQQDSKQRKFKGAAPTDGGRVMEGTVVQRMGTGDGSQAGEGDGLEQVLGSVAKIREGPLGVEEERRDAEIAGEMEDLENREDRRVKGGRKVGDGV